MKVVSFFTHDATQVSNEPPTPESMAPMMALINEMVSKGVLVDTGGVMPTSVHVRMQNDGTTISATDGPFTETKEVIGGFAVLNVASKDEAIAWSKRFMELVGPCKLEFLEVTGPND